MEVWEHEEADAAPTTPSRDADRTHDPHAFTHAPAADATREPAMGALGRRNAWEHAAKEASSSVARIMVLGRRRRLLVGKRGRLYGWLAWGRGWDECCGKRGGGCVRNIA